MSVKPLYYVLDDVIHKRPVAKTTDGVKSWTMGFPVCTVSDYLDADTLCEFFNDHDKPSLEEPTDEMV